VLRSVAVGTHTAATVLNWSWPRELLEAANSELAAASERGRRRRQLHLGTHRWLPTRTRLADQKVAESRLGKFVNRSETRLNFNIKCEELGWTLTLSHINRCQRHAAAGHTSPLQQPSKLVGPIRAPALVGKTFVCELVVRRRKVSLHAVEDRVRALRHPRPQPGYVLY